MNMGVEQEVVSCVKVTALCTSITYGMPGRAYAIVRSAAVAVHVSWK